MIGPTLVGQPEVIADIDFDAAVLVVVDVGQDLDFHRLLKYGARVIWDLRDSQSHFNLAADAALHGGTYASASLSGRIVDSVGSQLARESTAQATDLSAREIEVLGALAEGLSNAAIADRLFISNNTVKNHVRAIMEKLQASSRTEAVVLGIRAGVLDPIAPS